MITLRGADLLAARAHVNQTDKLGEPYVNHVRAVAEGLQSFSQNIQIAGLLHDIVEDTSWTLGDLRHVGVPEESVLIIHALTRQPGMTPRRQIDRVIEGGYGSILVKISDNAHNSLPNRSSRLPRETRERLKGKYSEARERLWACARRKDVATILAAVNPSLMPELEKVRTLDQRDAHRRADLDNKQIAMSWISGMSILEISIEVDCTQGTVSNRLRKAREQFPDLPWAERQSRSKGGRSGIKEYLDMKDGKPGESRIPEGSVIRSAGMRKH